jgi:hypothetical protein
VLLAAAGTTIGGASDDAAAGFPGAAEALSLLCFSPMPSPRDDRVGVDCG